jgi:hypothetical protein
MTRIGDDSLNNFDHGRTSSIGTSAAPLTSVSSHAPRGVQIKAAIGNTGTVYVGNSDVTANAADATDGFPLVGGEALFVPVNDPSKVYVIGSASGQTVFYLVV